MSTQRLEAIKLAWMDRNGKTEADWNNFQPANPGGRFLEVTEGRLNDALFLGNKTKEIGAWDEYSEVVDTSEDNSVSLCPTYGTMAGRYQVRAAYHFRQVAHYGKNTPKGRDNLRDARFYEKMAQSSSDKFNNVTRRINGI